MKPGLSRNLARLVTCLLAAWWLCCWAPTAHADNGNGTTQPCSVNVTAPSSISIPITSASSGRVGVPFLWTANFTCPNNVFAGNSAKTTIFAHMAGATVDPNYGVLFPTGTPNLWFLLESIPPANPLSASGDVALLDVASGKPGTATATFRGQFVVTGSIPPGSAVQIPPLTLISYFYNGDTTSPAPSSPFGSVTLPTGVKVVPLSCMASNPVVQLPPVVKSQLAAVGAIAGNTPFSVDLTGCPAGTQLKISLSGSLPAGSGLTAQNGVVASTGSTASEVAVQVLYGTNPNTPVDIGGSSFTSFTQAGGNLTIAYSAQYYAIKPVTTAGTVSAVLTYTLSYP